MKRRLLPILLAVFLTLTTVLASPVDACAADTCSEGTGNSEGAGYDEGVDNYEGAGNSEGAGSSETPGAEDREFSETFESGIAADYYDTGAGSEETQGGEEAAFEETATGEADEISAKPTDPGEEGEADEISAKPADSGEEGEDTSLPADSGAYDYDNSAEAPDAETQDEEPPAEFTGGYLELPEDRNAPVLDDTVSYAYLKESLVEDTEEEQEGEDSYADALSSVEVPSAYPLSSEDQGKLLSFLTGHYPTTRSQYDNTCWAHESAALAEFYLISHGLAEKDLDLSDLHTAYWCYANGTGSPVAGYTGDSVTYKSDKSLYNPGGNILFAAQTLMQLRGFASEETFPESMGKSTTRPGSANPSTERQNVAYLKNYYTISKKNRNLAKQAIMENGAVGASIFSDSANSNGFWNLSNAALCTNKTTTDHAITIVGWDDDYPKEKFSATCRPSVNGAWLVRNSWSNTAKFDRYSYCWLSYADKSLTDFVVFEMMGPEDPDFDNSYFYDSQLHTCTYYGSSKCANVFKANGNEEKETLEAVTMEVGYIESSTSYTVRVYRNVAEGKNPETGTLVPEATTKGKISANGIYTIPLKEPVELDHGENFAVMVSLSHGLSVATELGNTNLWGLFSIKCDTKNSSSWIFRYDGWHKMAKANSEGNLVLHALTVNGTGEGTIVLDRDEYSFNEINRVGDHFTLSATAYDRDGIEDTEAVIAFESSDEKVASVDPDGTVRAVGNGSAVITARSGRRSAKCAVTVALKEWTVTLDGNGGAFTVSGKNGALSGTKSITTTLHNGSGYSLQTPVHTVYEFSKWKDNNGNPFEAEGEITILSDLELTAEWIVPTAKPVVFSVLDEAGKSTGETELKPGFRILLLSDTPEAFLYYTTDGSDPKNEENPSRTVYTSPIVLTRDNIGDFQVKAYAQKQYYNDSSVTSYTCSVAPDPEKEWGGIVTEDRSLFETDVYGYPVEIPEGIWVSGTSYEEGADYTGYAVTFDGLRVYYGNIPLVKGQDYTISYSDNKKASAKASFTVKGKGNYSDKTKKKFTIRPLPLSAEESPGTFRIQTTGDFCAVHTGKAIKPVPELWLMKDPSMPEKAEGIALKAKTDYTIVYYRAEGFTDEERGEALKAITEAGDYKAVLTGKKNFTGERILDLKVEEKKSLSKAKITGFKSKLSMPSDPSLTEVEQKIAGSPEEEGMKLTFDGELLKPGLPGAEGTDYTITYRNNKKAGTATVILTGEGEYSGTVKKTFRIDTIPVRKAGITAGTFVNSFTWNREAEERGFIGQEHLLLSYDGYPLEEGTDFRVTCKKNTAPGTAEMTISGMGRFGGSMTKKYKILPYDITEPEAEAGHKTIRIWIRRNPGDDFWAECEPDEEGVFRIGPVGYTPAGGYADIALTIDKEKTEEEPEEEPGKVYGRRLEEGKEFTLKYSNHTKIKEGKIPTITVSGKGRFCGKQKLYFDLVKRDLGPETVLIGAPDKVRSKKAKGLYSAPVLKDRQNGSRLKAGTHYEKKILYTYAESAVLSTGVIRKAGEKVLDSDILKAGETTTIRATVTGKGWYAREVSTTYRVLRGVMSSAKVTINGGNAYTYTGNPVVPKKDEIKIKIGQTELSPTDYEIVSVENNLSAGTAKITLRGIRGYGGEKTFKFRIGKRKLLF
ncbi:MAG: chitobiase/beta-hexosaminidase C-terminal domain-containing protein [Lachnospiraceae bacterium]|nr:chitobiase/beta-hexosaminidase C-terminal domain-containing protein [Lachnospiraceae bacterium]